MSKIMKLLKKTFPKPNILQKRYLFVLGLVGYFILKAYVLYTPNPNDDQIPDQLREAACLLFADDQPFTDSEDN